MKNLILAPLLRIAGRSLKVDLLQKNRTLWNKRFFEKYSISNIGSNTKRNTKYSFIQKAKPGKEVAEGRYKAQDITDNEGLICTALMILGIPSFIFMGGQIVNPCRYM